MGEKRPYIYFDSASTTIMPKVISSKYMLHLESHENYRRQEENVGNEVRKVRKLVAEYMGGNSDNISFTGTSTYIANLITYSLVNNQTKKLKVITTAFDHHSTSAPWYELFEEGKIDLLYLDNETCRNENLLTAKIIDFSPDVIILTTVNNVTGEILQIPDIVKEIRLRKSDTIIICDAAQSCLSPELNGSLEQIDFTYFSAHKMFGPKDLGILHLNNKQMQNFSPIFIGGGGIHKIEDNHVIRKNIINQIESGTINTAAILSLQDSINYVKENYDQEYINNIQKYFLKKLKSIKTIEIYSKKSNNQIAFNMKKIHNHDLASYLYSQKIIIRSGNLCNSKLMNDLKINGCLRVSFNNDNTYEQVDKLIFEIEKFKDFWNKT